MSVPMSQYEALLEEVRCLRRTAQHVQELAVPLISLSTTVSVGTPNQKQSFQDASENLVSCLDLTMESRAVEMQHRNNTTKQYDRNQYGTDGEATCSEDEYSRAASTTHMSVSSEPISHKNNRGVKDLYHGTWPVERTTLWNSDPTTLGSASGTNFTTHGGHASVMSFASSSGGAPLDRVLGSPEQRSSRSSSQQLEAKMDMVYSLLAMLSDQEHADMGETLLALSSSHESCLAMRQSGCIPLLVQLVQSDKDQETRRRASQALFNLVYAQPDEKLRKRETKVYKLLEHMRFYTEALTLGKDYVPEIPNSTEEGDKHLIMTVGHLMKLSFDEGHRQAICQFGGIRTIADLAETEHSVHNGDSENPNCTLMRRYVCMALTNLTFGDSGNKALLCSFHNFMQTLVVQLESFSDELRQVTASVLRNLSWRADQSSKKVLRDVGAVTGLMKASMVDNKENTLKSTLSALWNLSGHCTENKAEICAMDGALGFLVDMLSYDAPSKSLAVIENSGGVLRNISSQIAVREDYREILRQHNCLQVLLEQLKSPSLTIVSNACGTLWNLSAKNAKDQEMLWKMGAPTMLRSLNHSKHKLIAMGSSAALKNLLSSRPVYSLVPQVDATARAMDLPALPTLGVRRQKALLQDLDQNLLETYDNVDSPTRTSADERTFEKYMNVSENMTKNHQNESYKEKYSEENTKRQTDMSKKMFSDELYIRKSNGADNFNGYAKSDECLGNQREVCKSRYRNTFSKTLSSGDKSNLKVEENVDSMKRLSKTFHADFNSIQHETLDEDHSMSEYWCRIDSSRSQASENDFLQNFSSLNLHQSPDNHSNDFSNESCSVNYSGSSSLPYIHIKRAEVYTDLRNGYPERFDIDDEDDLLDRPRDYTQYEANQTIDVEDLDDKNHRFDGDLREREKYGIYTETDLDQPTDYSLRYAENDSDSVISEKLSKNEFVQDTVKTYYTEGTPYQTPFNYSTATSMSDLRIDTAIEKVIDNDQSTLTDTHRENKTSVSDQDEKDRCSIEDVSEGNDRSKATEVVCGGYHSGIMSPEKPVSYQVEGTPQYFSRVGSSGSLTSISNESPKGKGVTLSDSEAHEMETSVKVNTSPNDNVKVVKFEKGADYTEQTPLMFSRTSSLASLDSVEQHSIHDDRSSIVSDFSRLTSGVVSPSELPDSPSQTVPPSPRPRKGNVEFSTTLRTPTADMFEKNTDESRPYPAPRSIQKPSVFEDNVTNFREESTPIQFSTKTSLSSLTIDDELKEVQVSPDSKEDVGNETTKNQILGNKASKKQDVEKNKNQRELNSESDGALSCDGETSKTRMLQSNSQHCHEDRSSPSRVPVLHYKYGTKSQLRQGNSCIPISKIPQSSSHKTFSRNTNLEAQLIADTVTTYNTEGTPMQLSHAGSRSDLSILSIPSESAMRNDYLPDDSDNIYISDDINDKQAQIFEQSNQKGSCSIVSLLNNDMIRDVCKPSISTITQNVEDRQNVSILNSGITDREQALLEKCMISGLSKKKEEKPTNNERRSAVSIISSKEDIPDLSPEEQALLEKCMISGMPKKKSDNRVLSTENPINDKGASLFNTKTKDFDELSPEEQILLEKCLISGMPKKKADKRNTHEETKTNSKDVDLYDLSPQEQAALEKCLLSGMPKHKTDRRFPPPSVKQKNESKLPLYRPTEETSDLSPQEQALLEKCLLSGMPKRKPELRDTLQGGTDVVPAENDTSELTAQEQALLEKCRQSAMTNIGLDKRSLPNKQSTPKEYSASLPSCSNRKNENGSSLNENVHISTAAVQQPFKHHQEKKYSHSKNGYVASAVENTPLLMVPNNIGTPIVKTPIADVTILKDKEIDEYSPNPSLNSQVTTRHSISQDRYSPTIEIQSTNTEKNGFNGFTEKSSESIPNYSSAPDSEEDQNEDGTRKTVIDTRMLDPDAMIESLDRFTAELVSQAASHLQSQNENKFQTSATDGDTWNDDSSPNDVTFPSMSGSAPNVVTFESESEKIQQQTTDLITEDNVADEREIKSKDFSSLNTSTLTESTLIAMEAIRLVTDLKLEAEMCTSAVIDLDATQPPSHMNSLTNSSNDLESKLRQSPRQVHRKRSLPVGLMIRRALNNSFNQTTSLESLENQSLSNLDHVNPPSGMCDIDLDLEGSMTSVASLQSEIADIRADFIVNGPVTKETSIVNPIFTVKQPANMFHMISSDSHCSDIENINPPSIFSEIADLCNSFIDVSTEAETYVVEGKQVNQQTRNIVANDGRTEVGGALDGAVNYVENLNASTIFNGIADLCNSLADDPIGAETCVIDDKWAEKQRENLIPRNISVQGEMKTETSSNESTPKKNNSERSLTPKQRRRLIKERYKTYTVDNEGSLSTNTSVEDEVLNTEDPCAILNNNSKVSKAPESPPSGRPSTTRSTSKEYRLNNPSRFQTIVINDASTDPHLSSHLDDYQSVIKHSNVNNSEENSALQQLLKSSVTTNINSSDSKTTQVPSKIGQVKNRITPKERRLSDRARFETQILDESVSIALSSSESSVHVKNCDESPSLSPTLSPPKSKLSIRRNFLQKRLENKERFKTKIITERITSPELTQLNDIPTDSGEFHLLLQKEANVVLKHLGENKARPIELLDCETLSLVSNDEDDDSDHNSGCSINYRTYHKSWGLDETSSKNIPIIKNNVESFEDCEKYGMRNVTNDTSHSVDQVNDETVNNDMEECNLERNSATSECSDNDGLDVKLLVKPKIIKPNEESNSNEVGAKEETGQGKSIRGRRKPLYSKHISNNKLPKTVKPTPTNNSKDTPTNIKPTSSKIISRFNNKTTATKPPVPMHKTVKQSTSSKMPQSSAKSYSKKTTNSISPKIKSSACNLKASKPSLERQGTFTKGDNSLPKTKIMNDTNDTSVSPPTSIPKTTSRIARPTAMMKPQTNLRQANGRSVGVMKSASSDRALKTTQMSPNRIFNRSPSVDARDLNKRCSLQNSSSNQSLKNSTPKRSSAPPETTIQTRSSSNSSIAPTGSRQITSRIASLWKKVEENKKKAPKIDTRVWIQTNQHDTNQGPRRLIRSNTFDDEEKLSGKGIIKEGCRNGVQYQCESALSQSPDLSF